MAKGTDANLIEEKVYSLIHDADISKHLDKSLIWGNCFKQEDLTVEVLGKNPGMYEYTVKFNGVKPVQVTKIRSYNKK